MKLSCSVLIGFAMGVNLARAQGANFPNGGMWVFGSHGLQIYNIDGSKLYKELLPDDICPASAQDDGTSVHECRSFSDVVSDGVNYVWTASNNRDGAQVEAFSLHDGELAGVFPTCSGPRGLTLLPWRDEVWFRCVSPNEDDEDDESGYWDSFSTTSITENFPEIKLKSDLPQFNDTAYGQPVFAEHANVAYSSDYRNNVLHKVDLEARAPLSNITIPNASGGWDIGYNPINKHLFMRTYVCCSCGSETSDVQQCREYRGSTHMDPVFVLTGPNANPDETQLGSCDSNCVNSLADTIGVVEIDTMTDTVVGYHKNSLGFGASAVYVSPDAEHTVLMSVTGPNTPPTPQNIRLLKPGINGALSTFLKDIELPTLTAVGAPQFINSDLIAVASSADDNELYLVKISTGTVTTVQLDTSGVSTGSSRGRILKYVAGTPYLWVTAKAAEEGEDRFCYVVMLDMKNLADSKVVNKVMGVDTSSMLFVENMGLAHIHRVSGGRGEAFEETQKNLQEAEQHIADLQSEMSKLRGEVSSIGSSSTTSSSTATMSSSFAPASESDSSGNNDALSIVAMVVGIVAVGVALVAIFKKPVPASVPQTITKNTDGTQPLHQGTTSNQDEELSMGSKRECYA